MRARLTVVAKSIRSTISPLQGITATLMGIGAGPWLAHHGSARRAVYGHQVARWWPVIPASILVILALVKATCALEASTMLSMRDSLTGGSGKRMLLTSARYALRMRNRYLEWLKEQNKGCPYARFAPLTIP